MARKTKAETQKTVASILDAAEVVFAQKGVANTTMADLAKQAGISRGAVYGHYPDKVEVCLAMCVRALSTASGIYESKGEESALQTLRRWGLNYLQLVHSTPSVRSALEVLYVKCEQSPEYEPLMKIRQVWEKRTWRAVAWQLKKATGTGELPTPADPLLGNLYLQSLLAGISTQLWFSPTQNAECWTYIEKLLDAGLETLRLSSQFSQAAAA